MKAFTKKLTPCILPMIFLLLLSACAGVEKRADEFDPNLPEAKTLLLNIQQKNSNLEKFKGIGKIQLTRNNEMISARMAFLGLNPSHLRIEVINPAGQKILSLSVDNNTIYFISHSDNVYYETHAYNVNMKLLISMNIKVNDIISLLSGKIPVKKHSSTELIKADHGDGWILVLKKRWSGVCEKIHLDKNRTKIQKVEFYKSKKKLRYTATFEEWMDVDGFKVPKKMILTDNKHNIVKLRIDAYTTNFEVEENVFVLKPL